MTLMKPKRLKTGDPGHRHPYVEYEADPLWPLIEKALGEMVENQDLIERTDRNYIIGYLCKTISKGRRKAKSTPA